MKKRQWILAGAAATAITMLPASGSAREWTIKQVPDFLQLAPWEGFKGTRMYHVGLDGGTNRIVYEYDLWAETSTPIPGPVGVGELFDVSDQYILYCITRRKDLWLFDGTTNRNIVPYDVMNGYQAAKVSGEYVVWQQGGGPLGVGIFLYNITTGTISRLDDPDNAYYAGPPDIDFPYVSWEDGVAVNCPEFSVRGQILIHNIQTGTHSSSAEDLPCSRGCDFGGRLSYPYLAFVRTLYQWDDVEENYKQTYGGILLRDLRSGATIPVVVSDLARTFEGYSTSQGNTVWAEYSIADRSFSLKFRDDSGTVVTVPLPRTGRIVDVRLYGANILFRLEVPGVGYVLYVALVQEPEYRWVNPAGGGWSDPANWDPHGCPSGGADTVFELAAAYTVTNYNHSANSLAIDSGEVTFDKGTLLRLANSRSNENSLKVDGTLHWNAGQLFSHHGVVGASSNGRMTVNDGKIELKEGITLGQLPGCTGELLIRGTNSSLKTTSYMGDGISVGDQGIGRLEIREGGQVQSVQSVRIANQTGSQGSIVVDGTGSSLCLISTELLMYPALSVRNGKLAVQNGGEVRVDSEMTVGRASGGLGEVLVAGSGSILSAGMGPGGENWGGGGWRMEVGAEGSGSMEIRDGGRAELHQVVLGNANEGVPAADSGFRAVATAYCASVNDSANWFLRPETIKAWLWVEDDEARLDVAEDLTVGWMDSAFVLVEDGGGIECGSLYLSTHESDPRTNTTRSAWVHGDNATMSLLDDLNVSASTDARAFAGMLVSDRGQVSCRHAYIGKVLAHNTIIGNEVYTRWEPWPGHLRVDGIGTEFHARGTLHVGNQGQGSAEIYNGGKIIADTAVEITGLEVIYGGTVSVGANSVLQSPQVNVGNYGQLVGTGIVVGNVRNLGGYVAPGFSPGTLTIQGDYLQETNGVLDIEIGPDGQDVLAIIGRADIRGRIRLTFVGEFAPTTGQKLSFLQASGPIDVSGAQVEVRNLNSGFLYSAEVANGQVSLVALNDAVYEDARPTLTIVTTPAGTARVSWDPPTPGFVLQASESLTWPRWTTLSSGVTNPVEILRSPTAMFYRLQLP